MCPSYQQWDSAEGDYRAAHRVHLPLLAGSLTAMTGTPGLLNKATVRSAGRREPNVCAARLPDPVCHLIAVRETTNAAACLSLL
jgi:hypothetical protein